MPLDKCRGLNFLLQNFYSWTRFFSARKKTESSSRDSEDKEESWLFTGSSLDCKGRLPGKTLKKIPTSLPPASGGEEGKRSCPGRNLKQSGGRLWWRGSAQHRAPAAVCQGGGRRGALPPCVVQRGQGARAWSLLQPDTRERLEVVSQEEVAARLLRWLEA